MIRIIPYNLEPITINILRILFDSSDEFCLCSESLSSYEGNSCPLIVMLAGLKAIEEYKCLCERFLNAKFFVLLSSTDELLPLDSIRSTPLSGAFYVEELNKGFVYILHAVAWGATVFSYKVITQATTQVTNELMLAMARPDLTSRDKNVLSLIVAGNDNNQSNYSGQGNTNKSRNEQND